MKLSKKIVIVLFMAVVLFNATARGEGSSCPNNSFGDRHIAKPTEEYYATNHICEKCVKIANVNILPSKYKLIAIYHKSFSGAYMYDVEEDVCLQGEKPLFYSETQLYLVKRKIQNQTFCTRQEIQDRENNNKKQIIKVGGIGTDGYFISNNSSEVYKEVVYEIVFTGNAYKLQEVQIDTDKNFAGKDDVQIESDKSRIKKLFEKVLFFIKKI